MSASDFEILSKLGEGTYSSVYKVLRKSDSQIYAMKKVRMANLKPKEKNNALNEIRILASIDHPNIISYKQAFFDEEIGCLCIIMEYAEGGDLYQKILDCKKSSLNNSENFLWHLLIKLSRALKVMHDLRIMHRDLKSANVFLGKNGKVKLGDLNVSKVLKEGLKHTQTGTPYYASPEVWKDEPYGVKSDIWSLGCVLYEAAALRPPFQAEDMKGLYKKVTKGVFSELDQYSQEFNEMIKWMLCQDPEKRPSASDILRHPFLAKKFHLKQEAAARNSSLISTIRVGQNFLTLKDRLPESKYTESNNEKKDLPEVKRMARGGTYKSIYEYYNNKQHSSKKVKEINSQYKRYSVKSILRENYGALRLPKIKYPSSVSVNKEEESSIGAILSALPERSYKKILM